ncbi:MAG: DUF2085 domain-containing protein [Candidatus Helarchaeota archaeon]
MNLSPIYGVKSISEELRKDKKEHSFGICAHHRKGHIDYYTHTILLNFRDKEIRLCARCTGIYTGLIVGIVGPAIFGFWLFGKSFDPYKSLISAIILATPLLIDWGTQKVGLRESKNILRVTTGFLFGVGFSLIQFTREIFFWTAIVIVSYASIMFSLIAIRNMKSKNT